MTFDNCDRFVGPMPVQDFLEHFLPSPEVPTFHPKDEFVFFKPSVSRNEFEFASPFTLINVHIMMLTTVLDRGNSEIWTMPRSALSEHHIPPRQDVWPQT